MKPLALLAAAGSLAALSAPAQAASIPSAPAIAPVYTQAMGSSLPATGTISHHRNHDRRKYDRYGRYYEPRHIRRGDRVWRGRDGNDYCKRENGTTGLIIGAAGGALIGRAIDTRGDRTVGTLLGAVWAARLIAAGRVAINEYTKTTCKRRHFARQRFPSNGLNL